MLSKVIFVLLLSFIGFCHAQSGGTTANSTLDPNSVDATTRSGWCAGEIDVCGKLCSGDTSQNDCDVNTLKFNCACQSNNSAPGLEFYQGTMPSFICEKVFSDCINSHPDDLAGQTLCKTNEKKNCGSLNASDISAAASSSSSSSSSASSTASSTASGSSSSPTNAAPASFGKSGSDLGAGLTAAVIAAVFGVML